MLESLLDQLRKTHDGEPWYGSSRTKLLAGLTFAEAASHPARGKHSVWQLVLHMTAWSREVERRLGGSTPADPLEGDWPAVGNVSERAWEEALAELERAHRALLARASSLTPAQLDRRVGEIHDAALGTGVTVAGMLVGIAQHEAYHTGQVALLRSAIEAERKAGSPPPARGGRKPRGGA